MPTPVPVSIAIPVFNGEQYLVEAIESVLAQTVSPAEFRVFDNASTDDSAALASQLLPSGSVVTSATNVGAIENFNRAARAATQPYFMWLGADDRLSPTFLERAVSLLEANPKAPACLTGVQFIDDHGQRLYTQIDAELASENVRQRLSAFVRRRRWTEFYCLYRTEALLKSPLALPTHGADVLLTWWFLLRGPFAVTPERLLDYRVSAHKLTESVEDVTEAITPGAKREHWLKVRMWWALWQMADDPAIAPRTRRAARRELALVLFGTAWWFHLAEDVSLRWPIIRRVIGLFVTLPRVARPRPTRGTSMRTTIVRGWWRRAR